MLRAWAALIFLTCFEVLGVGNTAVLDNLFALFLTAAVAAFYIATEKPPRTADEKVWLVLAGLAAGLAFLTKGFLAVAVPVLVLMPYLVWQQRSRDIFRMGWLPLLTTLLVALPWGVGIGLKEPDFWHFFFWNEHIRRFLGSNAQHHEPLWYFLMVAPAMFLPWTFLVPAAVRGLKQSTDIKQKQQRLIRLCICWIVLPFLFFSVSKGKLLTYILPCFPPFAILLASGLAQAVLTGKRKINSMGHWRCHYSVCVGADGICLPADLWRPGHPALQPALESLDDDQCSAVYDSFWFMGFKMSSGYKQIDRFWLFSPCFCFLLPTSPYPTRWPHQKHRASSSKDSGQCWKTIPWSSPTKSR